MNFAAQTLAVTAIGLRGMAQRRGNSLVIVIGIAGVVAVLLSVLAMSSGFRRTIQAEARSDRVIILTRGVTDESSSSLSREHLNTIAAAPGIKRDASDKPIISGEVVLVAPVARKQDNSDAYITLRGVGEQHMRVRPELELIAGRMFEPGLQELIVGESARAQFANLDLGDRVRLHDGDWTIVGVFAGGDNVRESEVMSDAQTVLSAYKLGELNTATALLADDDSLAALRNALSVEPALGVEVLTEPAYLAVASRSINRLLTAVAYTIGGIMAVGALFGALNTMYSAVASRTVEIATLRAIGYRAGPVVGSIVIESLLLALAGSAVGIALAYAAFNGRTISTLGGARWDAQVVYALSVTPALVAVATLLACMIGLIGGLFPAIRAARASVADALRAV
jgi:putative ABC transport system permease protein